MDEGGRQRVYPGILCILLAQISLEQVTQTGAKFWGDLWKSEMLDH